MLGRVVVRYPYSNMVRPRALNFILQVCDATLLAARLTRTSSKARSPAPPQPVQVKRKNAYLVQYGRHLWRASRVFSRCGTSRLTHRADDFPSTPDGMFVWVSRQLGRVGHPGSSEVHRIM